MATTSDGMTVVYEDSGDGSRDARWCIEEDADGRLYLTSNAMTRERITPAMYAGWDTAKLVDDLIGRGVPEAVVDRYVRQAEVWD